LIPDATSIGD